MAKKRAKKSAGKAPTVQIEARAPEAKLTKRLEMGKKIGEGGMGVVKEAFDANLGRKIAVKQLKSEFASNESETGRLIEEAQITAQLDHPNVVPIYETGSRRGGSVFFTMKLIRGRTLTEILDETELASRTAGNLFEQLQVFLKVCDAVAFAHSRGVIHQDLKPDNIMIGEFGEVYLMDWGFAKLKKRKKAATKGLGLGKRKLFAVDRADGTITTTIYYMAPEYMKGLQKLIDERTDIFCLGGILYKILTGKPPFYGDTEEEVKRKAVLSDIKPPGELVDADLPPRLVRIAMKALSRKPSERYQTVAEIKQDVEGFLQCGWQFERVTFSPGAPIVKQGDPGDEAYVITTGRCRVYKKIDGESIELGELGVGDVFGELAVFASQERNATVEAIDQVSAMVLTRKHFEEDLGMSFWLGVVVKALAERFVKASDRITELEKQLAPD